MCKTSKVWFPGEQVGPKGLLHTTLVTYGSMELIVEGPVEQELLHEKPPGVTAILGAGNCEWHLQQIA